MSIYNDFDSALRSSRNSQHLNFTSTLTHFLKYSIHFTHFNATMLFTQIFFAAAIVVPTIATKTPKCTPFPSSMIEYSSGFKQPKPPLVQPEFTTNFVQHKWSVAYFNWDRSI